MDKSKNWCSCAYCHMNFVFEDAVIKTKYSYGIKIEERCCPYCNKHGFTAIKDIEWFDKHDEERL